MALLKSIELNNGVIVNYHRIVSINKITNHSVILEIAGYTSKEKRIEEANKLALGEEYNVYIDTNYISVPYDEKSTIKDWYAYLKTTDKYAGAEDDEDVESDKESSETGESEISSETAVEETDTVEAET